MGVKRGLRGLMPEDDRSLLTCLLTRDELAILFEGIKHHRHKQTRSRLQALYRTRRTEAKKSRKNKIFKRCKTRS